MTKKCKYCGGEFKRPDNVSNPSWGKRIFCSRKCMGLNKVTLTYKNCANCGKEFSAQKHIKDKAKFCSHKCSSDFRISEQYHENQKKRKNYTYKKWRRSILERDGYKCVMCGCLKGRRELQVDHIKSFSLYPELRLDMNNGRTLCVPCHKKTETWGVSIKKQKAIAA